MNGKNGQFINSPDLFLRANVINSIRWFDVTRNPEASILVSAANTKKEAQFDVARVEVDEGNIVNDLRMCNTAVTNDTPINGYWCPYISGNTLPGYIDLPRRNPKHRFVFTPAMNGCAFVVTNSPRGAEWFRLYHNQHPHQRLISDLIQRESGDTLQSYFSFEDYGTQDNPNAFNFLYYRNSNWVYVSQPQRFIPESKGFRIGYRPNGVVVTRSVF